MVLIRLPLTLTGSVLRVDCPCARAACCSPQLQNTMPAAAPTPVFRKSRRVVMTLSSQGFYFVRGAYVMPRRGGKVVAPGPYGKFGSRSLDAATHCRPNTATARIGEA